jgi:hypothetical protein
MSLPYTAETALALSKIICCLATCNLLKWTEQPGCHKRGNTGFFFIPHLLDVFSAEMKWRDVYRVRNKARRICKKFYFLYFNGYVLLNVHINYYQRKCKEIRHYDFLEYEAVYLCIYVLIVGARGSVVCGGTCYKPEGRGIESRWSGFFFLDLILPAALWL